MNKKLLIIPTLIAPVLFSNEASAISLNGNAKAIIQRTITATEQEEMDFGTLTSDATPQTATLSANGNISAGTLQTYGTTTAGQFEINAAPSTPLNISFTDGNVSDGANSMNVNNFTTSPTVTTTDGSGTLNLNVGADLGVGANQAEGDYSGTYGLTVGY